MEALDKNENVILVDWKGLAFFGQVKRFLFVKSQILSYFMTQNQTISVAWFFNLCTVECRPEVFSDVGDLPRGSPKKTLWSLNLVVTNPAIMYLL